MSLFKKNSFDPSYSFFRERKKNGKKLNGRTTKLIFIAYDNSGILDLLAKRTIRSAITEANRNGVSINNRVAITGYIITGPRIIQVPRA